MPTENELLDFHKKIQSYDVEAVRALLLKLSVEEKPRWLSAQIEGRNALHACIVHKPRPDDLSDQAFHDTWRNSLIRFSCIAVN